MAIVVLPRIEQENPFGELAEVIGEQALPYLVKLYANKDKIAKLSDTELTDFSEVLQRYAPELVSGGKINWDKVNEWAQSDDQTKLQVASFLFDAKRVREDFANAPLIAKLQAIDVAGSINPQELNKIFVAGKMQQKLAEAIGNSNLPDEYKLLFLANIEKFAEKPHLIPILEKVLGGTTQAGITGGTKDSGGGTGSWQFSLDGSKPFGIQLEEPILTPPQVSPPQIPVVKQQPVVKQGGGGTGQRPAGGTKEVKQNPQQPNIQNNQPFDPNYKPKTVGLISAPDLVDLLTFGAGAGLGAGATWLASILGLRKTIGKVAGKVGSVFKKTPKSATQKETQNVAENVAKKETQKVAENVAKKETQKVAENVAKKETQKVLPRTDIYSRQDVAQEVEEKINKKIREEVRQKIQKEKAEQLIREQEKHKQLQEEAKRRTEEFLKLPKEEQIRQIKEILGITTREPFRLSAKDMEKIKNPVKVFKEELGVKQSRGSFTVSDDVLKEITKKVEQEIKQNPSLREQIKRLSEQTGKDQKEIIKLLITAKLFKQEARPITQTQIEKAIKPHKKMPPFEQLLREEYHISSLKPKQTKTEELRKIDEIVFKLMKPPQPLKPSKTTKKSKKKGGKRKQ